jgi:hypothetical protein
MWPMQRVDSIVLQVAEAARAVGNSALETSAKVKSPTIHVTRHTSHVTRHTSHVTRHTSHVTRHTSHVTRHTEWKYDAQA